LLTIDLKELGKNVGPAVEYLRSRLDEPVKVKGSQVRLTHTSAKAAKLLLHKFLYQVRLEGYRIIVVHSELVEMRAPEKKKRHTVRDMEAAKPSAWETVPDQWYLTPPGIIRPRKRSKREMKRVMRGL
jgi:hypothetical protein